MTGPYGQQLGMINARPSMSPSVAGSHTVPGSSCLPTPCHAAGVLRPAAHARATTQALAPSKGRLTAPTKPQAQISQEIPAGPGRPDTMGVRLDVPAAAPERCCAPSLGGALALLLLLVGFGVTADAQAAGVFQEDTKPCHPGCEERGNCNGETGTCDCPFGLAGLVPLGVQGFFD